MTVEEFYAFTDTRPDEEKWELIEGEPVLNAPPSKLHQRILKNLVAALLRQEEKSGGTWEMLPGLGVKISGVKRPEPDLLIVPNSPSVDLSKRDSDDVIVTFEILSPSTEDRDLRWKRNAYTALASLSHYVVIAQDSVEVVVFARDAAFADRRYRSLGDKVTFPQLGVSLALSDIYRNTGLS